MKHQARARAARIGWQAIILAGIGLWTCVPARGNAPATPKDPPALTGTLTFGTEGLVRLLVEHLQVNGADSRVRLTLVNEGSEKFRTSNKDAWIVAMKDGRKIAMAARTDMLSKDLKDKLKGEDEHFRRAAIEPDETYRLMLAPPYSLQGEVVSVELRSHELEKSLLADDTYRPARRRLETPVELPPGFQEPADSLTLSLAVIVGEDGKMRSLKVLPPRTSTGGPMRFEMGARAYGARKAELASLFQKTIAGWTFEPARRGGKAETSRLVLGVGYTNHRVVRSVFGARESAIAPALAGFLRDTFPFFIELPDLHGFVVAGPLPAEKEGWISAQGWFVRTGEESGKAWIAIASRTITARDPENGGKCGCRLISDYPEAPARLMDNIAAQLGVAPQERTVFMTDRGLIPSGYPETYETSAWRHDAVSGVLDAALGRSEAIRKSALGPDEKKRELGTRQPSAALPAAAEFPYRGDEADLSHPVLDDSVQSPKLLTRVTPDYPEPARRDRVEGDVILWVRIDEEGRVRAIEILKGIPALNLSAIEAVSCWKYEPARKDGKPGPVDFTVVITYSIR